MFFAKLRIHREELAFLLRVLSTVDLAHRCAQFDRYWKEAKKACERDDCGHLVPEEAMNCVNLCTSKACFEETYTEEKGGPLEDGEIDHDRNRKFTQCLRAVSQRVPLFGKCAFEGH